MRPCTCKKPDGKHQPGCTWYVSPRPTYTPPVVLPRPANAIQVGGDHYRTKKVQPWEAMESCMTYEEFAGYLRGNVIKYTMRCSDKGGIEDLKKAAHYLTKLLEVLIGAE